MTKRLLICALFLASVPALGQTFSSFRAFRDSLNSIASVVDSSERDRLASELMTLLRNEGQVPFRLADSAAFLYHGTASSVFVAGDFNRWSGSASRLDRLGPSALWIREATFPEDARLDYKLVRDGQWILDPANPREQWGGFGPNSELRMPAYNPSPYVTRRSGRPAGSLSSVQSINSTALGYRVNYQVYTPPAYGANADAMPVVYVTDGHEYSDDRLGSMRIVLDNMLSEGLIEPVLAVFIDPRVSGTNLRGTQYTENAAFASFVADELVPAVDASYRTRTDAASRAIMGTSLGGLNAAYFGAVRPETFGLIGIQSPAFHAGNTIYSLYRDHPVRDLRIHMTWGTIFDVGTAGEDMASILSARGYVFETLAVNEGHSWGAWRALLDEILVYFFGIAPSTDLDSVGDLPSGLALRLYPVPSNGQARIAFELPQSGHVSIRVVDMVGREVYRPVDKVLLAGPYDVAMDARMPAGVYVVQITTDRNSRSLLHTVVR